MLWLSCSLAQLVHCKRYREISPFQTISRTFHQLEPNRTSDLFHDCNFIPDIVYFQSFISIEGLTEKSRFHCITMKSINPRCYGFGLSTGNRISDTHQFGRRFPSWITFTLLFLDFLAFSSNSIYEGQKKGFLASIPRRC